MVTTTEADFEDYAEDVEAVVKDSECWEKGCFLDDLYCNSQGAVLT